MADGAFRPALPLTGPERATVGRNLMFEGLNKLPEILEDDMALAIALACIVDTIETRRPNARVRAILSDILNHPRGR